MKARLRSSSSRAKRIIPLSKNDIRLFQEASVFDKQYNGGHPTASIFWMGYLAGKSKVAPMSIVEAQSVSIEYRNDGSGGYLKISKEQERQEKKKKAARRRKKEEEEE
jgi:hypothetical protein